MLMMVKYGCDNPADCGKFSLAKKGDQIVLIQNGVFWAIDDKIDSFLDKGIEVFAIAPDLFARGYSEEVSKVPLLSYDGFIELLENAEQNLG